jgi:hypothetical protein
MPCDSPCDRFVSSRVCRHPVGDWACARMRSIATNRISRRLLAWAFARNSSASGYGHDRQPTMRNRAAARECRARVRAGVAPPCRSPRSSERPEPSLATLMGPPGSPWSRSAPINQVRSIEPSAAWLSRSSTVSQREAGVGGPPFKQAVRRGLALRSDQGCPSRSRRAGSGSTGSRTRPSQGQQHDAPLRS